MPRRNKGAYLKWVEERDSWYIVWYVNSDRRMRSAGTECSREAESKLGEFIQARDKGSRAAGPRDPCAVPVAAALALYAEEHAPTTKDPLRIACAISVLLPFWKESMVGDVTKETSRAYVRDRARAPATARRELGTLRRRSTTWSMRAGSRAGRRSGSLRCPAARIDG